MSYEKRYRPFEGASISLTPEEFESIGSLDDFVRDYMQRLFGHTASNDKQIKHDVATSADMESRSEIASAAVETPETATPVSFDPDAYYPIARPDYEANYQGSNACNMANERKKTYLGQKQRGVPGHRHSTIRYSLPMNFKVKMKASNRKKSSA